MTTAYGIVGQTAPDFRFDTWLANVGPAERLRLADIAEPIVYLYNFQLS